MKKNVLITSKIKEILEHNDLRLMFLFFTITSTTLAYKFFSKGNSTVRI